MNLCMIGCSHKDAAIDVRQQLAFDNRQTLEALDCWRSKFPNAELALLATCNRVELYAAGATDSEELTGALLDYRNVSNKQVEGHLLTLNDSDVVRHLYRVTASLESMVVGEPQILAQVKQAYLSAQDVGSTGPLLHDLFQSALRTARRVAGETKLHKHRVSIPSVAIADLASCVFESFDDKHVLVIGAGEMAEETLRYLHDAGKPHVHVINRNAERGKKLASQWAGQYHPWSELWSQLTKADLAISTTSASEPVVTAEKYDELVTPRRHQRALCVLDLAVPRDFDAAIADALGVYLYSLDDLAKVCTNNQSARAAELPKAEGIITQETRRFWVDANHRAAAPVISNLRQELERPKKAELERLFQKLPDLEEPVRQEIEQFADRLVNKILHPPMESLRDASQEGTPHGLLDAVRRLFQLED